MIAFMRNRRTTENRAVELDGAEFLAMREETHPTDGRPVWEQTSSADQLQQAARIKKGNTRDEDVGDALQPVARIMDNGDPIEIGGGLDELTEAEVESGQTPEGKREQLAKDPLVPMQAFGPQNTVEPVPVAELHDDEDDVLSESNSSSSKGSTASELKEELRDRGLPVSGNKAELQARLDEDNEESEDEEEDEEEDDS